MRARPGVILVGLLAVGLGRDTNPARAQVVAGSICISTYADANANGVQELEETPLAGVNVNLATGGAIIATHITGEDIYCFENLLDGVYTVTFTDSPLYRTTTAREGTFVLEGGQRLTIDPFGAFPIPLEGLRAVVAAQIAAADDDEPLEISTRLLLSTGGSMLIMLSMVAIGVVMVVLMTRRRSRKAARAKLTPPLPGFIAPPPMRPEDWQRQTGEHREADPGAIYPEKPKGSRP